MRGRYRTPPPHTGMRSDEEAPVVVRRLLLRRVRRQAAQVGTAVCRYTHLEVTRMLTRKLVLMLVVVGATLAVGRARLASADGCGLLPLKPLPPLGCRDLEPVCECDASGRNCSWRWVCVR